MVVLAWGLDGRAWRLEWPTGTLLYELDLPDVIDFKEAVLAGSALEPHCGRRPLRVDLGGDWPATLVHAGFDATQPTVWLIEGLLPYLTAEAGDLLLSRVNSLSAQGSEMLLEHNAKEMESEAARPVREAVEATGAAWLSARDDLRPWLAGFGWDATVVAGSDPAIGCGRDVPEIPATWLVHAKHDRPAVGRPTSRVGPGDRIP